MLSSRNLILLLVVGFVLFVLFAFTLIGLVGEALIAFSAIALVARAIAVVAHRGRRS